VFPGRHRRLFARFTDDEYAEVTTAAGWFGLTPTGFCAHTALDAARNLHAGAAERIGHEALANLQAELFQTRVTLNRLRAELSMTRGNDRASTDDRDRIIAHAAQTLDDLDSVIPRIHRTAGSTGSNPPDWRA
jgi:uncharacterized protein (DUF1778 family)